jgi:hypothetical protein
VIEHYEATAQRTVTVMEMGFTNMPAGIQDDGLYQNPCNPIGLIDDRGFARKPSHLFFSSGKPYLMLRSALD